MFKIYISVWTAKKGKCNDCQNSGVLLNVTFNERETELCRDCYIKQTTELARAVGCWVEGIWEKQEKVRKKMKKRK